MQNFMRFFKAEFVPLYGLVLLKHRVVASMVENHRPSWSTTLGIYGSLLGLSLYIYSQIVGFHLDSGTPTLVSMGVFQTIYVFALACLLQLSFVMLGSHRSYLSNLKLTFLNAGMLYVLNSLLLPFQILMDQGGSRGVTFIASIIVVLWVLRCWYVMADFNGLKSKLRKVISLLIISALLFVAGILFTVVVPYFVNII